MNTVTTYLGLLIATMTDDDLRRYVQRAWDCNDYELRALRAEAKRRGVAAF